MALDGRRWACIHDKKPLAYGAPEACGKVAFFSLVPPVPGMILRSEDFLMPDGSPVKEEDAITCGSCHAMLDMRFAKDMLTILEEQ